MKCKEIEFFFSANLKNKNKNSKLNEEEAKSLS